MRRRDKVDPRNLLPSRADPESRGMRKQLEKESSYGIVQPIALGLAAVGLIWNMENQVRKYEERKDKQEREMRERDDEKGSEYSKSRGRAKSSRRPPRPASSSRSTVRGDDRRASSRYDGDDGYYTSRPPWSSRDYDPYYYPPSSRGRNKRGDYDDDHYYYNDYRAPPRRERYFVEDTDGIPRSERRKSQAGLADSRSVYHGDSAASGTGAPSSTTATASSSHHSGSQHLADQYDDGFEKKRFDGMPTEPPVDEIRTERRGRRSRRDSW